MLRDPFDGRHRDRIQPRGAQPMIAVKPGFQIVRQVRRRFSVQRGHNFGGGDGLRTVRRFEFVFGVEGW